VTWMIEHPVMGICIPEDLPHDYILGMAKPYLGEFISTPSDWTPLQHYRNAFEGYTHASLDLTDTWQFKNFLVGDRD
jgi:homospermidine synthase